MTVEFWKRNHIWPNYFKEARFKNIRIAWDFDYDQFKKVEGWIEILKNAGFRKDKISVFMIYNWNYNFHIMELKRQKCFELGVQISDCRYRPLNAFFDNYNSYKASQTNNDYFISPNWTDQEIRQFRRNVRKHNICIRHNLKWDEYSVEKERGKKLKRISHHSKCLGVPTIKYSFPPDLISRPS